MAKREGRATSNGLVIASVDDTSGTLLELACETDFVAKSAKFQELADKVIAAAKGANDVTALQSVHSWARNNQSALGAGAAGQERQGIERPGRIPLARRGRQPLPGVVGGAGGGSGRHQNGYELPPEVVDNVHELTPAERQAAGIARLPETMAEALELMERSELVAEALGEHVFSWFLRNKRKEWDRYQHHVSRFELDTYLPVL